MPCGLRQETHKDNAALQQGPVLQITLPIPVRFAAFLGSTRTNIRANQASDAQVLFCAWGCPAVRNCGTGGIGMAPCSPLKPSETN